MPMQIISRIKKSLPVLLGLLILWVGLFFYATVLNKSNQEINNYIPEKANFVFTMKVKDFIKSATYSLIFNSRDQELLNVFEIFLNKQRTDDNSTNIFGIDFTQDFTVYGIDYKEGQAYVVVFDLMNPDNFDSNVVKLVSKNQVCLRKENIGFIANYFGKEKINQEELKLFLQNLKSKSKSKTDRKQKELFNVTLRDFKINDEFKVKNGNIDSEIKDHEMQLNGEFTTYSKNYQTSNWTLIPNGLHIENSLISNAMQDSLQAYLIKIGISLKRIDRISMNYYGVEIQETDKGVIFTPLFDLLLTFKEEYNFNEVFKDLTYLNEFGFEKEKNVIHAGKLNYFIDSIDRTTFFIGNHENKVVRRKSKSLFSISGEITNLTTIKGGGFLINSVVGMFPPFKASKNMFEKVKSINLEAIPKNNKVAISGKIEFKEKKYVYNEFLRFYLTLQGEY
ncbi:MAG: hypothetical protein ACK5B9_09780 [Flavobacteriia bacterium]|jgi:hypothetical protein